MARSSWKGPFVDGYLLKKADAALAQVRASRPPQNTVERQVAISKLLAASGDRDAALSAARDAVV